MHTAHQEVLALGGNDAPECSLVHEAVQQCLAAHVDTVQQFAHCQYVEAYTDGSAPIVNPGGPAGFSAVMLGWHTVPPHDTSPHARLDLAGFIPARNAEPPTSNNRAEVAGIMAALVAACALPSPPATLVIRSDSDYAVNCATGRYKRKKNLDLWECFDRLSGQAHTRIADLRLEWLKGHAAQEWNEVADELATRAALNFDDAVYRRYRAAQRATGREMPNSPAPRVTTLAEKPPTPPPPSVDPAQWIRGAHYTLVLASSIDGGGQPNVGRGLASGLYQLWTRAGAGARGAVTHDGDRTHEEAEYLTLIAALDDLLARIAARNAEPASYALTVYSRRELVIKQLDGSYRVHSAALQPLQQLARARLDRFASAELIWKGGHAIEHLLRT